MSQCHLLRMAISKRASRVGCGKNLTLLPRRSFRNGGAAFSQSSSKHALGFVLHLSLT